MVEAELRESVDAALGTLSEVERAVLVLYHQEEVSYEGIAAALGLPINTVRTHLHRGRKRLGELLRGRARGVVEGDEADERVEKRRTVGGVVRHLMAGGL